jgi:phosphopantetheine--protein transferase-like protein
MTIGIDLVYIKDFKQRLEKKEIIEKIFSKSELAIMPNLQESAGIFAAKEAFMKAFGKKVGWLDIWIELLPSGKPTIHCNYLDKNQKAELSISHDGDYATAVVIIT